MPIEVVRGPVMIRSWHRSDAAGLARVIVDNLDHLRPWIAVGTRTAGQPRAKSAASTGAFLLEAVTKPDEFGGRCSPMAQIVGGVGTAPAHRPGRLRDRLLGAQRLHPPRDRDGCRERPDRSRVRAARHRPASRSTTTGPTWRVRVFRAALGYALVGEEPSVIATPEQSGVHLVWRLTRDDWAAQHGP